MTDRIVNPDTIDWDSGPSNKGKSKYNHLMDGEARVLDMRDYGHTNLDNFRITIQRTARDKGLISRARKLDKYSLAFQIIGKR